MRQHRCHLDAWPTPLVTVHKHKRQHNQPWQQRFGPPICPTAALIGSLKIPQLDMVDPIQEVQILYL
jgi:hypothetical protein